LLSFCVVQVRLNPRTRPPQSSLSTWPDFRGPPHTSIRDTSAGVNLEAMAHGLPIICIAHQGVADITDEACAERIEPGTIEMTVQALADSIIRLAENPTRRQQMGIAAATRAKTKFSWDEKFDRMVKVYENVIGRKSA